MERRRHPRTEVTLEVDVETGGRRGPALIRDISREGVFLTGPLLRSPAVPEVVRLHFEIWTGEQLLTRQLQARRVREGSDGAAYVFDPGDPIAQAAVAELLHYRALQPHRGGDAA